MIKKSLFFLALLLLGYALWSSNDFKIIASGVAVFLFGMLALQQGFRVFSGGFLQTVLRASTDRLWKRVGFGIISTVLTQSSSLVSLLTISFLSAGLIDLAAGIAIVFAANLGTTTGAWLVAGFGMKVKIAEYAMPVLVYGVVFALQKNKQLQGVGYVLSGIGLLLLGIHYMKEGFEAFRATLDLNAYAMPGATGLLIYVLVGVAATVIIQSSDATMVLIITALSVKQLSYENALAMAIGANIGTTVTAVIGSLSANIQGKRLALAHFLFNFFSASIALLFFPQFMLAVDWLILQLNIDADDYGLKLAAFHALFNGVGVLLLLPQVNRMAAFLQKLLQEETVKVSQPCYLNRSALAYPEALLAAIHQESLHLYHNTIAIMVTILGISLRELHSDSDLNLLVAKKPVKDFDVDFAYQNNVKSLYSAILQFMSQAQTHESISVSTDLYQIKTADLALVQALKDCKHLQKNLILTVKQQDKRQIVEYNKIRAQILQLIRDLESFRIQSEEDELNLLALDHFRADVEEQNLQMNRNIDQLIRSGDISAYVGASLMNDNAYMYAIKDGLITMAQVLFVVIKGEQQEAEKQLQLEKEEILHVLGHADTSKPPLVSDVSRQSEDRHE